MYGYAGVSELGPRFRAWEEHGLQLVEEGGTRVPLLPKRDLVQRPRFPGLLHQGIGLAARAVEHLACSIGLRQQLELVEMRKAVEQVLPLELAAIDPEGSRSGPEKGTGYLGRYGALYGELYGL